MYRRYRALTLPAVPAVEIAVAKAHLRVDHDYDDALITSYVETAIDWTETLLDRALITRTMRVTYTPSDPAITTYSSGYALGWSSASVIRLLPDGFRHALEIPRAPMQTVTTVSVTSPMQVTTVLMADDYRLDMSAEPARLTIHDRTPADTVTVDYVAGYGDTPATIPASIRNAILLMTAHLYEHRGDGDVEMPQAIRNLLNPYRLMTFGR